MTNERIARLRVVAGRTRHPDAIETAAALVEALDALEAERAEVERLRKRDMGNAEALDEKLRLLVLTARQQERAAVVAFLRSPHIPYFGKYADAARAVEIEMPPPAEPKESG